MNPADTSIDYQIQLEGIVPDRWFDDLKVSPQQDGNTVISGNLDQAALHGVLVRVRDLGLVILSISTDTTQKGFWHE